MLHSVTAFFWTLEQFCHDDLLPFLFADAEDDRAQYTMVVYNVMSQLRRAQPIGDGGVRIEGEEVRTFRQLADFISARVQSEEDLAAMEERRKKAVQMKFQHAQASALGSGAPAEAPPQQQPQTPFVRDGRKVGRNEPCPCGSGKKFKQCHGRLS